MAINIKGTVTEVTRKDRIWTIRFVSIIEGKDERLSLNLDVAFMNRLVANHKVEVGVYEDFIGKNGESILVFGNGKTLVVSAAPKGTELAKADFKNIPITIDIA